MVKNYKTIVKLGILIITVCKLTAADTLPDTLLTSMWNFSVSKLKSTMSTLGTTTTQFPRRALPGAGKWETVAASDWTSGFYPGCLWFAYERTKDTTFRNAAQKMTASLSGQSTVTTTHDVGFKIFCSYGNGYRLLNTSSYKTTIFAGAASLATRYKPLAGITDSWSFAPYDTGWEEIMDNMMNLEIFFWSAANGGDSKYYDMAVSHATKAMTNHIRPDSSTYHVVRYSQTTGAVISRETRQGYSNSSCWARGQSWAVYGFTMAYRFTKDAKFLDAAKKTAAYFVNRLPADRIPYWDFNAPGIPADTVPRDASASAVVASALLELSTLCGTADSLLYRDNAISIIKGLYSTKYKSPSNQASIFNHSTGSRMEKSEVDMGLIYADYYFLEALVRYEKYSKGATAIASHQKNVVVQSPLMSLQKKKIVDVLGRNNTLIFSKPAPGVVVDKSGKKIRVEIVKSK